CAPPYHEKFVQSLLVEMSDRTIFSHRLLYHLASLTKSVLASITPPNVLFFMMYKHSVKNACTDLTLHPRETCLLYNSLVCKQVRSEEHTSELQSRFDLVCRLLLEKKNMREKILLQLFYCEILLLCDCY